MTARSLAFVSLAVFLFGFAPATTAQDAAAESSEDPDLEIWPWYITGPTLGLALALELTLPPDSARFRGAGPIDASFSGWVRDTEAGRARAARASDVLLYVMSAAPVVDAGAWTQAGSRRSRVTYRLLTADALAFSVNLLLSVATKDLVRRARPYDPGCVEDETYDGGCDSSSRYRGFVSGHTSTAFTGAALVCAHQRLRGQSAIGRVECIASLAIASVVGALRMVAEKHYFADVVGGAAVGFLAGFIIPVYVYPRRLPPLQTDPRGPTARAW